MVCRLGMLCVSSAVGSRLPLGNADPGDGGPRRRITRRKSVDQALDYFFFVDRCGRFNFSQRPDICACLCAFGAAIPSASST
jgi:hypothetical protein